MALVIKDRVKETTTTTGTGTYTLAGAVSGFETFTANLSNADTTYYVCTDNTDFEVGLGTFTSSGTTLARTTVLASSNSNNAVNWSSGTRTIFMTYPADKAVFKDASNNINGTFVGDITGNADTATTLETARTINGTSFNGGANITVTAAAGTLTGSTLNSGVTASSLTSLGTLASNLNLGGQDIVTTTSNQDIDLQTHGTGKVVIKGNTDDSGSNPGAIKLNCEANSHGQTLKAAPHSESATNTITLPSSGGDARLVTTSSTATLTNKTFDVEGTGNSISNIDVADFKSGVLDTDISSVSGSDDTLASAKAIKTYVDAQSGMTNFILEDGDGTEVTVADGKEVKFVEGGGIDINWTDTSTGSDGDPYDLTFTINAAQTDITSLLATDIKIGEDDETKIDFETADTINFYAGNEKQLILTDGALTPGTNAIVDLGTDALEFKDAYFDGTVEADAITIGGTALSEVISDTAGAMFSSNTETGVTVTYQDADNTIDVAIDAAQTAITSVVNTSLEIGRDADNRIKFGTDNQIIFEVDGGDNVIFKTSGEIEASSLDISGDADIDGTLEADAITVGGTALNTVIAGVTVTDATNAAHVLVTDNESTNEENLITFVEGATSSTGNVGLEMDGNLTYNPSTGTISSTIFKGNIDAVDGDFDGTLEADAITLNGTAITTVATLSTGISNGNVLVANANVADNDFLKVDGTSIEGRSASEVVSDLGVTTASAAADEATALAIALG